MSQKLCSVFNCPNGKLVSLGQTTLYPTPKKFSRRLNWNFSLWGRLGDTPIAEAFVCASHFKSSDFHSDSKTLIDTAVPSVFLRSGFEESNQTKLKRLKSLKQELIDEHKKLENKCNKLSKEIGLLRTKFPKRSSKGKYISEEYVKVLRKCFSPAQIEHLMGRRMAKWSVDDVAVAYTINSLASQRFYSYLRHELKFPLPAMSNVRYRLRRKNGQTTDDFGRNEA